jgi:hypothetical protein
MTMVGNTKSAMRRVFRPTIKPPEVVFFQDTEVKTFRPLNQENGDTLSAAN